MDENIKKSKPYRSCLLERFGEIQFGSCENNSQQKMLGILLFIFTSSFGFAQTIELEYLPSDYSGDCVSETDCLTSQLCYGIKYTPSVSGTITSYTFGLMGNCDGAYPFIEGSSCVMNDNSTEINGCLSSNAFLVISSGNSGIEEVVSGTPIILHNLCFDFDLYQFINIEEDDITGLTVSIDSLNSGNPITEFPTFDSTQLSNSECPCNIELLSSSESLSQVIDCLAGIDTVQFNVTPSTNIIVNGMPEGVVYELVGNTFSLYGNPEILGDYTIDVVLPSQCDSTININLQIQTPTCVMNKNHCYLDIPSALEEVIQGDTIIITSSISTNQIAPLILPPNIFIEVKNNITWNIQN